MALKDNFLNVQPSVRPQNETARVDELSTRDKELESNEGKPKVTLMNEDAFVNSVNDAEEIETCGPNLDEEA